MSAVRDGPVMKVIVALTEVPCSATADLPHIGRLSRDGIANNVPAHDIQISRLEKHHALKVMRQAHVVFECTLHGVQ